VERPSDRRNGGEDGDVEVTRSVRLLLRYCYAMQSAVLHGTRRNGGGGFPGARLTMRAMLRRVGPVPRALSPVGRFLPCGPRTSRAPHVGFYYGCVHFSRTPPNFSNFPSHRNHIETLNIENDTCIKY
jgi:hypothetical protein